MATGEAELRVAAERTLSQPELNRALLARQLLLERGRGSLPRTVERIGGIQAQYAPSMYVGLWTRLEGFERDQLTRALERNSLVQGTLLRSTIHLVTPGDWWTFAAAVRAERRERWLKSHGGKQVGRELAVAARRVAARLADGPLPRKELQDLVGKGAAGISGINVWLDLIRVPPSGTWERRRADLFGAADQAIGPDPQLDRAAATVELARAYLRGFGPASASQIAQWAGLGTEAVNAALEALELRRFVAEDGAELVDLPRLALPDPETPAPVRFLPIWDATLLVHARRTQILPEEHRPKVFNTRTPQSMPTFLVDGQVAGSWSYEKGRVVTKPFSRLAPAARRDVAEEAERLAAFHG